MSTTDEEYKKTLRMNIINKALEDGWSVKKSNSDSKTFEFTKNESLENDYKGLVIFSKSNICEDIQKHLNNLEKIKNSKMTKLKKIISSPL